MPQLVKVLFLPFSSLLKLMWKHLGSNIKIYTVVQFSLFCSNNVIMKKMQQNCTIWSSIFQLNCLNLPKTNLDFQKKM